MKNTLKNIGEYLLLLLFVAGFIIIIGMGILGGSVVIDWATLSLEQQFELSNLCILAIGLVLLLCLSVPISLGRSLCKKQEIVKIPEKIPTEEFDEGSMRFILTNLPYNRLRLEALRNMTDEIFPGWKAYSANKKNADTCFSIVVKEFEYADFPPGTKDPAPGWPLPLIEKFTCFNTYKLFQNGIIIGWRKTLLDRIFFLGPQYLVAFPSGFIFATHTKGLRPEKCS